jgi:predicted PolB exonuclease-like 3'-5' exonuclease
MFKTIDREVWAFDLEWCPDPVAGRILYGLPDDLPDAEVVAEMWTRNGATEEDPMPFLKTVLCRVVSIAAVQRKAKPNGEVELNLLWLPRDVDDPEQCGEASIVGKFLTAAGKLRPQLVGFNSTASDLKILVQRAAVLGLQAPGFCARPDKPWEGPDYFSRNSEAHIDMMDILGTWGKGGVSLNEIASLSGIPGKMDTSGDQVPLMWLQGRWREIVQYNCYDALTTYLVWLRLAHLAGHFTPAQYEEEQERVRELIMTLTEDPAHDYLTRYFDEWERLLQATGQHGAG